MGGTDLKVVALCMSDEDMPETTGQRLKIADKLIDGPRGRGVALANTFVDLLVQPISTRSDFGVDFLKAIEGAMAVAKGLDGRIINPLDRRMMVNLIAAETLAGRDKSCMKHHKAHRAKTLEM